MASATVVMVASPAFATTGRIDQVTTAPDGHLSVFFSAIGLGPNESIDPTTVVATIDGQKVPATAKLATAVTQAPTRATMLTIDVSGSMKAPIPGSTSRMQAAKTAADAYLTSVPTDVLVGLVTFSDVAAQVVAPTMNHAAVRRAVDSLAATNGNTALYDAVVVANNSLGRSGLRNQLLITDGNNDRGTTTAAQARANVKASGVTLDAVAIGSDTTGEAELAVLAQAGGGTVVSANQADDLARTFESAAQTQATQIVIDVTVPPNVAGTSQKLTVGAQAGAQAVGDSVVALMPAAATGVPSSIADSFGPVPVGTVQPTLSSQPWFLPVAIAAVGLGLFVMLGVALLATDSESQTSGRVRRRLSRYSLSTRQEKASNVATTGALGQSSVARSALELAGRGLQSRDLDTNLGTKLEAAGVPLRPAEWLLIHVSIAIGAGLVFMLLSGFSVLAALIGLVLGTAIPYAFLSIKEERRKAAFQTALPGTLQLLAGSLAAGYSLPQAVDTVVRESEGPMAVELNRAIVEARLGVPMEDALETVARRMDSVDFEWVVMAIRIQREVGGNLAEVLNNVATTMRERERLRRQVQVLSAEGRLSAIILGALPVVFICYLVLVRPEYIGLLVTTPLGVVLIVLGSVLLLGGAFWLRKVVKVEV
jgi:tight adherence protein B